MCRPLLTACHERRCDLVCGRNRSSSTLWRSVASVHFRLLVNLTCRDEVFSTRPTRCLAQLRCNDDLVGIDGADKRTYQACKLEIAGKSRQRTGLFGRTRQRSASLASRHRVNVRKRLVPVYSGSYGGKCAFHDDRF